MCSVLSCLGNCSTRVPRDVHMRRRNGSMTSARAGVLPASFVPNSLSVENLEKTMEWLKGLMHLDQEVQNRG